MTKQSIENTQSAQVDKRKLIMIPYAEIDGYFTGTNMSGNDNRVDIYLKNCSVACISAIKNAGEDTDVMLVSNIDIPDPYFRQVKKEGVIIQKCPFNCFDFGSKYTWSLAFYKLCAFYHISRECDYDYYCYLDADVYVQGSFKHIWQEAEQHIMLFDLGHGLNITQYTNVLIDFNKFLNKNLLITQYGGEFVATNRSDAILLSDVCLEIYHEMLDRNITTTQGDEFILSLAASKLKEKIKHAGAYIFRFHTGQFRIVPMRYIFNPVSVLHIPYEKNYGFVKIYNYYARKFQLPKTEKVWRMLHLKHCSIRTVCSLIKTKVKVLISGKSK